jgi:hypothetical protein
MLTVFRRAQSQTTQLLLREITNFGLHDFKGTRFRVIGIVGDFK